MPSADQSRRRSLPVFQGPSAPADPATAPRCAGRFTRSLGMLQRDRLPLRLPASLHWDVNLLTCNYPDQANRTEGDHLPT
ncbi:hypothetical protein Sros01_03280 [Streptomyces roseochromogenus]|nr:hypothetical protein Sros01_03280 [Streptomyces roseochromogenus]